VRVTPCGPLWAVWRVMASAKENVAVLPKKFGGGPHGLGSYYLHISVEI
jgi:hypothetical protein